MTLSLFAVNAVICLIFRINVEALDLMRDKRKQAIEVQPELLHESDKQLVSFETNNEITPKTIEQATGERKCPLLTKNDDTNGLEKHQIYKRNLNRDYPTENNTETKTSISINNKIKRDNNVKKSDGTVQNRVRYIIKNETLADSSDHLLRNNKGMNLKNNTGNTPFRSSHNKITDTFTDYEIDFVKRHSDSDDPSSELDRQDVFRKKRSDAYKDKKLDVESARNIKEEIDKVYQDLSANVRLLSKLRERESQLLKKPNKKRYIIVDDPTMSIADFLRKKRCDPEVTVEMDTSKDNSPDRLEHIERKVEEEVLQVNVPLKCNTNTNV